MRFLISVATVGLLVACGGKTIRPDSTTSSLTPNKLIDVQVHWMKDKRKKFDFEVAVRNSSDNDIIIMLGDIQCSRGTAVGTLKHTFFNTGERTIDFRKGQTKVFRMVCDLGAPAFGNAKFSIGRVFDNPNSDGATKGKVLSTGAIEWTGSFAN